MRFSLVIFEKALRQQLRDRVGLSLTLLTAPFFVLFYWVIFSGADSAQRVSLHCAEALPAPECALIEDALTGARDPVSGEDALVVARAASLARARDDARAGDVSLAISADKSWLDDVPSIAFIGDVSSPGYRIAAPEAQRALSARVAARPGRAPLLRVVPDALGRSAQRTRFEGYVPNLLVFAIIMLVFSSSMAIAREVEGKTFDRLLLSGMRPVHYLLGVSMAQSLVGAMTVSLTLLVAIALGFESQGSLALAMGVATLTALACVGVGMIAASLARTVAQAFLVASSLMFLLMLFSGLVFPLPRVEVWAIAGEQVGPLDLIPTVHAARAMGQVLTLGADASAIRAELCALAALGVTYFMCGWLMFRRRHAVRRIG